MTEDTNEKPLIDGEAFTRTLTGFDQLAIQRMFGAGISTLGELTPRALLFIEAKREGMKDADAFRMSMESTIGELEPRFAVPAEGGDLDEGKASMTSGPSAGPTSS